MSDSRLATPPPMPDRLPMPVTDNHCHLDMTRDGSEPDVAAAVQAAAQVGVERIIHVGSDMPSARWTTKVVEEFDSVYGAVAIHPNEAPAHAEAGELHACIDELREIARHPKVRAIGETGLDYFRTGEGGVEAQHESFRAHIALAKELGLAMQIHDRDAHEDVLRILAEEGAPDVTVLHCFSGDMEMARECVRRGYFLSFSGNVTFKSAKDLRNALAVTPLENLLVETDAPYLTPHPHRGAANSSYLVPLTVRAMATTLNVAVPELCEAIEANTTRAYGPF